MSVSVLNRPVLVLNRSWLPIMVKSLVDALGKLIPENAIGAPKARVIDPSDYQTYSWEEWSKLSIANEKNVLRGVRQCWRIPEVILVDYDKVPRNGASFSRRMIYKRDHMTCQYCGAQPGTEELNMDHVIPRAQGGPTTWENVVLSCIPCNSRKANRTPAQAGMKLLKLPTKPMVALLKGERRHYPSSWQKFISDMYWEVPLENDEVD